MADVYTDFESFSGNITSTPNPNAGYLADTQGPLPQPDSVRSSSAHSYSGSKSIEWQVPNSTYLYSGNYCPISSTENVTNVSMRAYYYITAYPDSGNSIGLMHGTPYGWWGISLTSAGKLQWTYYYYQPESNSTNSTSTIPLNQWFRLEMTYRPGINKAVCRYYADPSAAVGSYTEDFPSTTVHTGSLGAFGGPIFANVYQTATPFSLLSSGFTGSVFVDDFAQINNGGAEVWIGPTGGGGGPVTRKGWGISR